jgi:hypothetical protein
LPTAARTPLPGRPRIKPHRSSTLTARQTTTQLGIRAITVARTLADIRRRLTQRQFTRVVNDARVRDLIGTEPAERLLGDGTHRGLPDPGSRTHSRASATTTTYRSRRPT